MIIITGGAGFIGSCLLAGLNAVGRKDVLVVDSLDHPLKRKNLAGKHYLGLQSPARFLAAIKKGSFKGKVDAVFHMGACSSTTEMDVPYLMSNNLAYSIEVTRWALACGARLVYASSAATYGDGEQGYADDPARMHLLRPLNYYGWSKQLFDIWVDREGLRDKVLGLKFFNVYGPNEAHKGEMRSLVDKAYLQVVKTGKIRLFKSHRKGIGHGRQTRDFIYVKDVVAVMLYALKHPRWNGIMNLGTGKARNWNDLAKAVFHALGLEPKIEYVDMPAKLRGRYQYHTRADMRRVFKSAKRFRFTPLEDAVADYVQQHLVTGRHW